MRFQIFEIPAFSAMKEENKTANVPTWEVFRDHKKNALLAIGTRLSESVTSNIYLFFVIVYLNQHLQINRSQAVVAVSIACLVSCATRSPSAVRFQTGSGVVRYILPARSSQSCSHSPPS